MRKSVDVAIIGGGIVGCALAYCLSKRIKGVVVIERRGVASEASGANYGMVWQQTRLPGLDLAMARRSLAMYEELTREVFDIDIEYEKKGGMTVFFTPLQKRLMDQVVQGKRDIGIPVEILDGSDARRLEPALSPEILGEVPAVKGFYMAAGHAHAFSHAPPTGEALAALIVDGQPTMSLEEASLRRFQS